jgi:tetratricopeptide (TPR) repeat protein
MNTTGGPELVHPQRLFKWHPACMASGRMWHKRWSLRGNSWIGDGVYRNMRRGFLCLLWSLSALAQAPQQNPLDLAIQAHWKARTETRFDEAAAKREEARSLLAQMPVDAPQFGGWVQNVAALYSGAGMQARAREVAEAALARTGRMGDAHPTRIQLLNMLAGFWQEDRNLLKAATYAEKAVSALEAAPPPGSAEAGSTAAARSSVFTRVSSISGANVAVFGNTFSRGGPNSNLSSAYQRLVAIYQQLGRPEAVAAIVGKMKNLAGDNAYALASLYEGQGKFDEAAAVYQKQVTQAAGDPQQVVGALQSLANLYQREQRYGDAAAALEEAIAGLNASGSPAARSQAMGMRQNLAGMLQQAGQTAEADQAYQQLLAESQNRQDPNYSQLLVNYANYLDNSKRSAQAESLLSDYMANHPQLDAWQESNLLYARANAARVSGDSDRAAEYERAAADKRQAMAPPPEPPLLQGLLQKANTAAWGNNPEEAFSLTLAAMAAAPRAVDREQIAWQVPGIASALANKKAPVMAEQLYQHLFGIVQGWSADNQQPLLNVAQSYPRFLMAQKERRADVPEAIERYRKMLMSARGAATGHLREPLQMTVEFERSHGSEKRALLAAEDLLALEASLSGVTSEPYLQAVEMLGDLYEAGGDHERSVRLFRQAVAIGDLVFSAPDPRRGSSRIRLAFALAQMGEFDEAERLANEAVALGKQMRPPQAEPFTSQLEHIRKMKPPAAKPASAVAVAGK